MSAAEGGMKRVGGGRKISYRALRGFQRLPALFSNLLAGYPEPFGVGNLLSMSWAAQGVYVVTKLGIPDLLQSGPKTVAELAQLTHSDEGRLKQLMRALAGFGLFASTAGGGYRLTPMSGPLVGDSVSNLFVKLWGDELWAAAGKMLQMVQSGQGAFELAHGQPMYELYKQNSDVGALFAAYMNGVTDDQRDTLVKSFDFGPFRHIVDVGGGRASLLTAVLQTYPHARGTILDQPHMEEPIRERIRNLNLADRCVFVGGNFLQRVPPGGDLYLIKHAIQDWNDASAAAILKNIAAAMRPESKLIIIDGVMDERDDMGRFLKMHDLKQMVWNGGKVRTRGELELLLAPAELFIEEIRHTGLPDASLTIVRKK